MGNDRLYKLTKPPLNAVIRLQFFMVLVRLFGVSHDDGMVNALWAGMPDEGKPWMIQGPQSWTWALEHARDQRAVTELLSGSPKFLVYY